MSDHLSSLRALQDPVIDLTDLYFFPVPGVPGRLALVLDAFPGARSGVAFSDAVHYRIRLAPAQVDDDAVIRVRGAEELMLDVTFGDVEPIDGEQNGRVRWGRDAGAGRTCAFRTGETGATRRTDISVFAGLRRDPFFMDVRRDVQTRTTRRLAFHDPGTDAVAGQNVLSIVLEFDADTVLGTDRTDLWAAAAETVSAGPVPARFERIGRPEMKNVLLALDGTDTVNTTVDLRDLYNLDDPFDVPAARAAVYRTRLDANLAMLDGLDDAIAWPFGPGRHHPLTETFVNDHLVLDTRKPFEENGFLEIERAALTGRSHRTCGGRWLNTDVIDDLYSVTVGGWDGVPVRDGVDSASVPATSTFPYLPAPNPDPPVPDPGVPVGASPSR